MGQINATNLQYITDKLVATGAGGGNGTTGNNSTSGCSGDVGIGGTTAGKEDLSLMTFGGGGGGGTNNSGQTVGAGGGGGGILFLFGSLFFGIFGNGLLCSL